MEHLIVSQPGATLNLRAGVIILCGIAILVSFILIWLSQRKKAAVGRREMQLFLLSFIIVEICEIFTVGGFPLDGEVRRGFTAVHIGAIVASSWILMLNGAVGYQAVDDGTFVSVGLILVSAAILLVGTGYIALDTGFSLTGYFDQTITGESTISAPNRSYALYTLYQLVPLLFIVIYFLLESVLVLKVLGEKKPFRQSLRGVSQLTAHPSTPQHYIRTRADDVRLVYLLAAALLFAVGQVFNYVISSYICEGTAQRIDGSLFQTFFTLTAVSTIWFFWSSITEDDWPAQIPSGESTYTP